MVLDNTNMGLMPPSPASSNNNMMSPYNYMNNFMGGINNMPPHMQGQVWEAFRAGMMYAQTNGGMMMPPPMLPPPGPMPPMHYGPPDSTKNGERLV